MADIDLDAIEARANAASEGPWERGDVWQWAGVLPEKFGEGRCALCDRHGEPVWVGRADINGTRMLAHKHRDIDPYEQDYWISNPGGLVVGPYDYDTGGVIDPADTEFIAHARTDVPALVAEVRRLRGENSELGRALHRVRDVCDQIIDSPPHDERLGVALYIRRVIREARDG